MDRILNALGINSIPEVKTDVGSDLDAVIQANKTSLGIGLFFVIVLAIVVAGYILKRIG